MPMVCGLFFAFVFLGAVGDPNTIGWWKSEEYQHHRLQHLSPRAGVSYPDSDALGDLLAVYGRETIVRRGQRHLSVHKL
jgi:hypothetical protein